MVLRVRMVHLFGISRRHWQDEATLMRSQPASLTAIVLAADRTPRDPVARAAGVPCKSLAPVGGRPMVLRVLDTSPRRIRFWANGNEHVLSPLLAANISVRQVQRETEPAVPGLPLDQLEVGTTGTVVRIAPGIRGAERRRLLDLGVLPGTQIKAEMKSPGGDPTAYLVRGALIALRADQARHIKISTEGSAV